MKAPVFTFTVACRRPRPGRAAEVLALRSCGRLAAAEALCETAWTATHRNVVTVAGANYLGEVFFNGAPQVTAWYIGLAGSGTKDPNDTMLLHPGWTEVTAYTQTSRAQLQLGTFVSRAADNIVTPGVFTMNGAYTVAGSFVSSDPTKAGTDGLLYNMADWLDQLGNPLPRTGGAGDTLTAQIAVSF